MRFLRLLAVVVVVALICGCEFDIDETELSKAIDKAIESNNPEICETLTDQALKDVCFEKVASGVYDAPTCNRIKNDTVQDSCLNGVAVEARDFNPCKEIESLEEKVMCMMMVTAMKTSYAIEASQNSTKPMSTEEMDRIQKLQAELNQKYEMLSNMMKAFHDTQRSSIENIKG
ncbi:MAG: hypothetical protein V1703_02820 [Candidatus Altiarchaeota archaeon]